MAINTQIHDRVATPSEAMKEYAFNFGMDNRDGRPESGNPGADGDILEWYAAAAEARKGQSP